nr:hypothetical protein MTCCP1_00034 [uncultured bacterium]
MMRPVVRLWLCTGFRLQAEGAAGGGLGHGGNLGAEFASDGWWHPGQKFRQPLPGRFIQFAVHRTPVESQLRQGALQTAGGRDDRPPG